MTRDKAKRSALTHVVNTFFDGSAAQVMAALIEILNELKAEKAEQIAAREADKAAEVAEHKERAAAAHSTPKPTKPPTSLKPSRSAAQESTSPGWASTRRMVEGAALARAATASVSPAACEAS